MASVGGSPRMTPVSLSRRGSMDSLDSFSASVSLTPRQQSSQLLKQTKKMEIEECLPLQDSSCTLYLPKDPSGFLSLDKFDAIHLDRILYQKDLSREFVVQGELLKFYVVIVSNQPKQASQEEIQRLNQEEEAPEEKREVEVGRTIMKTTTSTDPYLIDEKNFYRCFANCVIDVDVIEGGEAEPGITGGKPISKSFSRILDPKPSHTHHVELPRAEQVASPLQKTPDTPRQAHVAPASHEQGEFSSRNYFRLYKGATSVFVFPVEFPIAVKDEYLKQELFLRVCLTPSAIPLQKGLTELGEFERILNPSYFERLTPVRTLMQSIQVVQPFDATCSTNRVGQTHLISAVVENTLEGTTLPIQVKDMKLYLFDSPTSATGPGSGSSVSKFANLFKTEIPKDVFPAEILVTDQYSFVASVEHKSLPTEEEVPESFGAKLVFTWSVGCVQGNILSSFDVQLPRPSFQELMIYIDARSPVPLDVVFNVTVKVCNMGSKSRSLTLMLGSLPNIKKKKLLKRRSSIIKATSELLKVSSANATGDEEILANDEEEEIKSSNRTPLELVDDKLSDQPSVICLDKSLHLGKVKANSTVTANLRMIAIRAGLFQLEPILVHDEASQTTYSASDIYHVYVQDLGRQ